MRNQNWFVDHVQLRRRLIEDYKLNPMAMSRYSLRIGIHAITLDRFLNNDDKMQSKVYMLIEKYLANNESAV